MDLTSALLLVSVLVGIQTVLMLIDEAYYHQRRGLSRLEQWGHVADALIFATALAIPGFFSPTTTTIFWYAAAVIVSSLVITKDEWIHTRACEGGEHWVHAVLFVIHAPILIGIGWLWYQGYPSFLFQAYSTLVIVVAVAQLIYGRMHGYRHRH